MKLSHLSLTDFVTFPTLELDLRAVLTLIYGPNACGKTTIANAICFALTGRCRELRFKKNAKILVVEGQRNCRVTLTTEAAEFTATSAQPATAALPYPTELIEVLCDPMHVVRMGRDARQDLFRALLGSGEAKTVREALTKAKLKLVAPEQRQASRLPPAAQEVVRMPTEQLAKAERMAIEARRAAKRAIEALTTGRPTPNPIVEIGGESFDLRKFTSEKVTAKLAEVQAQRDKLPGGGNLIDVDATRARLAQLTAELTDKSARLKKATADAKRLGAKANQLAASAGTMTYNARQLRDEENVLREQFGKLTGDRKLCIASTKEVQVECPLKGRLPGAEAVPEMQNIVQAVSEALEAARVAANDLNAKAKIAEDAAATATKAFTDATRTAGVAGPDVTQLNTSIKQLQQELSEAEKWKGTAEQIATLNIKLDRGRNILQQAMGYETALQRVADDAGRVAALEYEREIMDQIAKALGDGGPVQNYLTEAVQKAPVDEELSKAWGLDVDLQPDGTILANGRAVELCSFSERWRVGMLVADLLARTSELGWIVLDQSDVLDRNTRTALMAWANRAPDSGYNNVILLCAEAIPPKFKGPLPATVAAWWLDMEHNVSRIE